jgi:tRNA(fMet)-specific endonuclease VapC
MYMLDTDTCIAAIRGAKTGRYRHVTATVRAKRPSGLCVSAITLAELEYGTAHSASPERNTVSLLHFLAVFDILPFGTEAAAAYGPVRAALQRRGTPIGTLDTLIAAHALASGSVLVTHNTREFGRVPGLPLEDWLFGEPKDTP